MRDSMLRRQKDLILTPVASAAMSSIHPNLVSVLAMLVGLLAGTAIVNQFYLYGLILWLFNRILDGLDGVVARVHSKQSDFGGYLDLVLDFIIYLTIPISFAIAQPSTATFWALVALIASFYVNTATWMGLSALFEKRRTTTSNRLTSMEMPVGIIEGAETILLYSLFCIFPGYTPYLFALMAILVFVTAGQRVWWAWRNLN